MCKNYKQKYLQLLNDFLLKGIKEYWGSNSIHEKHLTQFNGCEESIQELIRDQGSVNMISQTADFMIFTSPCD